MHVFVTGGTGLLGSALVAELLGNGHTVLALARSDASAQAAQAAGAQPLRGGLADLDVLRTGADQADAVIHLAFANDFSSPDALASAVAEESAALATLGEQLIGSDRAFVTVSGTPAVPGRPSTEADPVNTDGPVGGRAGLLTNIARQTGVSGYPGDGTQRWPEVHALDAAVLLRLAMQQALGWEPQQPSLLQDLENIQP